jgi:hypothetical protein
MNVEINWLAFLQVFAVSLLGASFLVVFYALGIRMLVRAGRVPVVVPAEFTDAITVITPKEAQRALKAAEKNAKKSPLTRMQKRVAQWAAYACFGMCALVVLAGIAILVLRF